MKKYIALTIGPIYKTLSIAKKTREIWSGSYIFSYIMKKIIFKLTEYRKNINFITPNIKNTSIFTSGKEVGLFHDRFIFEAENEDFNKLKEIINSVLEELGNNIFNHLRQNTKYNTIKKENVLNFIKNYFIINFIEKDLEENENPILKLSKYLDSIEQYNKPIPEGENYLSAFLKISNGSFLVKDSFDEHRFDIQSLPEIATKELNKEIDKNIFNLEKDTDIYTKLKELENFKNYHKYIAIVQADGDSFTNILKNNSEKLSIISEKLFNYAEISHKIIKDYGGMTIYAGGDDLLFFAPVKNKEKTIFDLLDEITKNFNEIFEEENEQIKNKNKKENEKNDIATVSFGLSISYYKFPLYEALGIASSLLFDKAKELPKNNIAFQVIKHSGQSFGGVLNKLENVITSEENIKLSIYTEFKNLLEETIKINDSDIKFLGSYHHKFFATYSIIEKIAHDKIKLKNYFNNYFNEDIHVKNQPFFEKMLYFINLVFISENFKSNKEKKEFIYAVLRFIKFIKGDEL